MRAKGDHQDQVHLDQLVLMIAFWEAGPCERWPKATQGGPSGSSPLRLDSSCDGQAGRSDQISGGQKTLKIS
jgi:hypothetical protein